MITIGFRGRPGSLAGFKFEARDGRHLLVKWVRLCRAASPAEGQSGSRRGHSESGPGCSAAIELLVTEYRLIQVSRCLRLSLTRTATSALTEWP
jgi:hypothetical protein